jgi:hypothetical protein
VQVPFTAIETPVEIKMITNKFGDKVILQKKE